jgi:hypothetical protein
MKFNLNEDGSKFMRNCMNQIWMRSSQMNPGTMIGGEATSTATDIGNRRLLPYTQVSKRYMILTHFGINNQTFTNGGAEFQVQVDTVLVKARPILSRCME